METKTLSPNANGFFQAAKLLQAGSLVAFPTETVYGLGADAYNSIAVAKVYAAKGRPNFNPLIVHVIDLETAAGKVDRTFGKQISSVWNKTISNNMKKFDDALSDVLSRMQ